LSRGLQRPALERLMGRVGSDLFTIASAARDEVDLVSASHLLRPRRAGR